MKNIIIPYSFLFLFLCIQSKLASQNIGVNTVDPSAKLHVLGDVLIEEAINTNFEENTLAPGTNTGDVEWFVTDTDGYNSNWSAKCPLIPKTNEWAILEYDFIQAHNKNVSVEFFFKYLDPNNTTVFRVTINGNDYFLPQTPDSWKSRSINFISNGTANKLEFKVVAKKDEANPLVVIDDIKVHYEDGHAFKLTDGSQADRYILESDNLGHASWVDLRTEIDATILDAAQELNFGTTDYELEIDNGNSVRIAGLKNLNAKFILEGYTLKGDPGLSIDIPNANAATSKFYYNSTNGQFIRGRYTFTPNPGIFATSWGRDNMSNGDYSTTFGLGNKALGIRSTAWGNNNESLSTNSTSWGSENTSTGNSSTSWGEANTTYGHYATTWGFNNQTTSEIGTTFGLNNINLGDYSTVFGNSNVVEGNYSTVWGDDNQVDNIHATVFGSQNESSGNYSLLGGDNNFSSKDYSFLFGTGLKTSQNYELSFGHYNYEYYNQIFSIGNGTGNENRSNLMSLTNFGELAIGVNAPEANLHIKETNGGETVVLVESLPGQNSILKLNSDARAGILLSGSDKTYISFETGGGSNNIEYDPSTYVLDIFGDIYVDRGNVGINEPNPAYDLELNYNSAAKPGSSSWIVSSDSRLKKDVHAFTDGLDIIKSINPVWFTYNGLAGIPEEIHIGTIAQELEAVAPYMVGSFFNKHKNGESTEYKNVDYGAMDFILINAIKDQQKIIESQEESIATLKAHLRLQQEHIDSIYMTLKKNKKE